MPRGGFSGNHYEQMSLMSSRPAPMVVGNDNAIGWTGEAMDFKSHPRLSMNAFMSTFQFSHRSGAPRSRRNVKVYASAQDEPSVDRSSVIDESHQTKDKEFEVKHVSEQEKQEPKYKEPTPEETAAKIKKYERVTAKVGGLIDEINKASVYNFEYGSNQAKMMLVKALVDEFPDTEWSFVGFYDKLNPSDKVIKIGPFISEIIPDPVDTIDIG